MKYVAIKKCDIANGPGFRVSLFVSGCARKCPGCFNTEAQNPENGRKFDAHAKRKIFDELAKPYIKGLSLLGGDPMSKLSDNRQSIIELCKEVKEQFPQKDIWMWTGYTYEELKADDTANEIFKYVDYIVDGPYIEGLKDETLRFCGSSNQRVLAVSELNK